MVGFAKGLSDWAGSRRKRHEPQNGYLSHNIQWPCSSPKNHLFGPIQDIVLDAHFDNIKLTFANVDGLVLVGRQTDPHSRPADLQGSFLIKYGHRSSQHAPSLSTMV